MATMNFSIPDDLKEAFNAAFEDENKSAIIAGLMRRAVEERQRKASGEALLDQMRRLRAMGPSFTSDEIRKAREEGRS